MKLITVLTLFAVVASLSLEVSGAQQKKVLGCRWTPCLRQPSCDLFQDEHTVGAGFAGYPEIAKLEKKVKDLGYKVINKPEPDERCKEKSGPNNNSYLLCCERKQKT